MTDLNQTQNQAPGFFSRRGLKFFYGDACTGEANRATQRPSTKKEPRLFVASFLLAA